MNTNGGYKICEWTGTNYVNDPPDRNEQVPNNFPRTLDIRQRLNKQAYLC